MTVVQQLALLDSLSEARRREDQVKILRDIKNYITGHELRKREYLQGGLIVVLEQILKSTIISSKIPNPSYPYEESQIWSQIAAIVCVIANGGPAFVNPLLHSSLLTDLFERLSIESSSDHLLYILKAFNTIADNLPLSSPDSWVVDHRLADLLYTNSHGKTFVKLISQTGDSVTTQQTCDAAMALICKSCHTERHKLSLVRVGVLTALCGRLASFIVSQGMVIPSKVSNDSHDSHGSQARMTLTPAPRFAHLAPVLEVLCVLTENSRLNASQLLASSHILSVLPSESDEFSPSDMRKNPWGGSYLTGSAVPKSRISGPLDQLLPYVPEVERIRSTDFPPLGTVTQFSKRQTLSSRASFETSATTVPDNVSNKDEYLLIPWLLYILRTCRGKQRLVASRLLTILRCHDLIQEVRTRSFGALVVPVIVRMLEDDVSNRDCESLLLTGQCYTEVTPLVLSQLIEDDPVLQRVAVEAKAIPKLASALKASFDQNDYQKTPLWRPTNQPAISPPMSPPSLSSTAPSSNTRALGFGGPSLEARHTMTFREGLLRALAAIAPSDDNDRKEICEQGVLAQIMLALEPFQSRTIEVAYEETTLATTGNSASTLLAACNAVRALTRSVTALRTRLVDADVGRAIVKLMHNPDPEVRIAATKVIANLGMDFSPLKATISEPELVKKLCEQVHSANARLRLESIWALKHLVLNAPNKMKRDVIDELGSNWIKHLIETDPYNIPPGVVVGLSEREYPPRSIHNVETSSGDVIMSEESDVDGSSMDVTAENIDSATDYNKHTVEDDLAIQEQLIDLIRNLFCGETASEIVEYLLGEIGYDIFFKIMMDRLRSRPVSGAPRTRSQSSATPRGIIVNVLYVLVHIASCAPKFRTMLCKNSALMRLVANFCTHADAEIRRPCCWVIINLTFLDDASDKEACRHRALELQKIGFIHHMQRLENDPNLDVKERAKTAYQLLKTMI